MPVVIRHWERFNSLNAKCIQCIEGIVTIYCVTVYSVSTENEAGYF